MKIGDKVRDDITGFEGVITGIVEYISGCDQALIQPRVKDDGEFVSSRWVDTDRLTVVEAGVFQRREVQVGSDAPAPVK